MTGLRQVAREDYGWVLYQRLFSMDCEVLFYDNESWPCSCGDEDCVEPKHQREINLVLYPSSGDRSRSLHVDPNCVYALPDDLEPRIITPFDASTKSGWLYAVALVPELTFDRIKVGYSEKHPGSRLESFRTTNPTAVMLGFWDADRNDERRVLANLAGRIGSSEVFQFNAAKTINRISQLMGVEP